MLSRQRWPKSLIIYTAGWGKLRQYNWSDSGRDRWVGVWGKGWRLWNVTGDLPVPEYTRYEVLLSGVAWNDSLVKLRDFNLQKKNSVWRDDMAERMPHTIRWSCHSSLAVVLQQSLKKMKKLIKVRILLAASSITL